MTHAATVLLCRVALVVASLFPLQADTLAPVADPAQVARAEVLDPLFPVEKPTRPLLSPHRGPGIAAGMTAVGALQAEDVLPGVDPLDAITLQQIDLGAITALEPTGEAPHGSWQIVPPDPGFIVIEGGRKAHFAPLGRGQWFVIFAFYAPDDAATQILTTTVTRGVVPPGPVIPTPPDPDVPTPPTPVVEGKRLVLIIHESSEDLPEFAAMVNSIQGGEAGRFFKGKGHRTRVLDKDTRNAADQKVLALWEPFYAGLKLPVILIAEKDSNPTKVAYKGELAKGATAAEVIELTKKAGG